MPRKVIVCPSCGSKKTIPIVFGLPDPSLIARAEAGKLVLRGCVIEPNAPDRHCTACRADFSRQTIIEGA